MPDPKDKPANFDEVVGKIRAFLGWRANGLEFRWVCQITPGWFRVVSREIYVLMDGEYVCACGWDPTTRTDDGPLIAARDIAGAVDRFVAGKGQMEEPA